MRLNRSPSPWLSFFRNAAPAAGFSLVEVMLIIAMMSLILIPYTMVMTGTARNTRGVAIQSSRSLIVSSLIDQMSPDRPDFNSIFQDSGMNSTKSESGQAIPFRRTTDPAYNDGAPNYLKATAFTRMSYLYLYNNSSDASNAPRYSQRVYQTTNKLRLRGDNASAAVDLTGATWYPIKYTYDGTNKVYGYLASPGTTARNCSSATNVTAAEQALFGKSRLFANRTFSYDVPNGDYTIKFYACDGNPSINTTSYRRLGNIYIEGVKVNRIPFGSVESGAGTYGVLIYMYDAKVADGVLNLNIQVDSASDDSNTKLTMIEVKRRT